MIVIYEAKNGGLRSMITHTLKEAYHKINADGGKLLEVRYKDMAQN